MTTRSEVLARQAELEVKLASLLTEYADAFAPDVMEDGEPCEHGLEDCDCRPPKDIMATEWLCIVKMTDLGGSGGSVVMGVEPQGQESTHSYGLFKYYEMSRWG